MENPFAVITGASSGIGLELARQFGLNGFDLLIASSSDEIFSVQEGLQNEGYNVDAVKVNLATYAGVENIYNTLKRSGREPDAVAINAGVGVHGPFLETDLKEEINLVNLNIISAIHLTKRILPSMKARGRGKILFTSSIASEMPTPFQAVYGASKAFLTSFAESIRNEVKDSGITISILMPGATNTNFFHRADMEDTRLGSTLKYQNDPEEVARQGFEALMEGKENVFAESFLTKLGGYAMKILPDKARAQLHRKWSEPGSARH